MAGGHFVFLDFGGVVEGAEVELGGYGADG